MSGQCGKYERAIRPCLFVLEKEVLKRRYRMIKNDIELDVKVKCIENGTTQAQIAEDIHTTKSYVNRIIKSRMAWSIKPSCRCWKHWGMISN